MTIANYPFWRVVPGNREGEYILPVMPPATVGPEGAPHIMGGVGLAAIIDAMELESKLPLQYAQVQFLSPTHHTEELQITCEQCGGGQSIAQYAGGASVNGRPTHRASAALGRRDPSNQTLFAAMPEVPAPAECPIRVPEGQSVGSLTDQFEVRIAHADPDRGQQTIWTRSKAGFAADVGWIAIISDFFLGAHPLAASGGASLDAMLRFVQGAESEWVLSSIEFASFNGGVVHGSARHFAEDGRLLAISSQSGVLPRNPIPAAG